MDTNTLGLMLAAALTVPHALEYIKAKTNLPFLKVGAKALNFRVSAAIAALTAVGIGIETTSLGELINAGTFSISLSGLTVENLSKLVGLPAAQVGLFQTVYKLVIDPPARRVETDTRASESEILAAVAAATRIALERARQPSVPEASAPAPHERIA